MARERPQLISTLAWIAGGVLFAASIWYLDFSTIGADLRRLGAALPEVLAASAAWHLLRTMAWSASFPRDQRPPFWRLARVRLAAEAFSFVTIRGVAGEPLKVVLLHGVPAPSAAAAVALERLSYMIVTAAILAVGGLVAMATLALSPAWIQAFRVITIAGGAAVLLAAIVLVGRGQYLDTLVRVISRALGRSEPSIVGRFALATERQLLHLARTDGRRLVLLIALQSACYVAMSAEVWTVLHAVGAPVSFTAALAVETFTRAASFASAFIPGNLGALEASNAAVVSALGLASGASALAVARRLRGLWWAGLGFLVYPWKLTTAPTSTFASMASDSDITSSSDHPQLAVIARDPSSDVSPFDTVAALPILERVLRAAAAARYSRIFVWAPTETARIAALSRRVARRVDVRVIADAAEWRAVLRREAARVLTVLGPATVVSTAFLRTAADIGPYTDGVRELSAGSEHPHSGVFRATPAQILDPDATLAFIRARRLESEPGPTGAEISRGLALMTIRPADRAALREAEATIRRATYKSTDPFLARFNRRLSLPVTMFLLRTPLTANALSVLLVGLGFYAAWLFSIGSYWTGVAAAGISLAASILDGCDGEIARLKYQESAFGCWVETFGDYSYYIAIFIGMTIGAVKYTGAPVFYQIGAAALAGSLLTFTLLIFLRQRITNGRPERLQATTKAHFYASGSKWAWLLAKIAVCATRSSMPYGIFVFALLGLLPGIVVLAMIGANVYWISLLIKLRAMLAETEREPVPVEAD
jgi:phosphatidylglycerophosphate synthase